MTVDQVIASSTVVIDSTGLALLKTYLGFVPTWALYAIPIALFIGIVGYFLHRRHLGKK